MSTHHGVLPNVIVALLLCVAAIMFFASRPSETKKAIVVNASRPTSLGQIEEKPAATIVTAAALNAAEANKPRTIRKLMLERDFAEAVSSVGPHSSAVEKATAADIISVCLVVKSVRSSAISLLDAVDRIETRCEALLRSASRRQLLQRAAALHLASVDDSAAGRVYSLARQVVLADRMRLNDEQLSELSSALASRDPVLIAPTVFVLRVQVADGSPDADLRSRALLQALGEFAPADATEFDLVATCMSRGQCGSVEPIVDRHRNLRETKELVRLVAAYRSALESDASAAQILAVR